MRAARHRRCLSVSQRAQRARRPERLEERLVLTSPQVIDINTLGVGSEPDLFVEFDGAVFFTADDGRHGRELWRMSDGDVAPTLVADLNPGSASAFQSTSTIDVIGNRLSFLAANEDGIKSFYLASATGTPELNISGVLAVLESQGKIFLVGEGPGGTSSLFVADSFDAEPQLLAAVLPSGGELIPYGGFWCFATRTATNSVELWRTDATESGTYRLATLNPTNPVGLPHQFVEVNSVLYFTSNDGAHGTELWRTDGTQAGTFMAFDLNPGGTSSINRTGAANGSLILAVRDTSSRDDVWVSDGTLSGTHKVADFASRVDNLTSFDGNVYFTAEQAGEGLELWTTDGTSSGTTLVKNIAPANGAGSSPSRLARWGDRLVFQASTMFNHPQVWETDGSTEGTRLLVPAADSVDNLTVVGDQLWFGGSAARTGLEPWSGDGESHLFAPLGEVHFGTQSAMAEKLKVVQGHVVFSATDGTSTGDGLWTSNGTIDGSHFLLGNPSNGSDTYHSILDLNGTVLVGTTQGLFVLDGGFTGPSQFESVSDISSVSNLTEVNGLAVFSATRSAEGAELWVTDGTPGGTHLLADVKPGDSSSNPHDFVVLDDKALFLASPGVTGNEVWITDGTGSGTHRIHASGSPLDNLTTYGEFAYFEQAGGLWRTDGTSAGTQMLLPEQAGRSFGWFKGANDRLLFSVTVIGEGSEIWSSEGTPASTVRVADLNAQRPVLLGSAGASVVFFTYDPALGSSVYASDGTESGTQVILGSADEVRGSVTIGDRLYFLVGTRELWRTDGTVSGTERYLQLESPVNSWFPEMVELNGTLFLADSSLYGRELTRIVLSRPGDANNDGRVDQLDYAIWEANYKKVGAAPWEGDFNLDGRVTGADFTIWADHYDGPAVGVAAILAEAGRLASDRATSAGQISDEEQIQGTEILLPATEASESTREAILRDLLGENRLARTSDLEELVANLAKARVTKAAVKAQVAGLGANGLATPRAKTSES